MTRRLRRLASALPFLLAVLAMAAPLRADWKILYYDKNGNVVGVEGGEYDGSNANPNPDTRGPGSGAGDGGSSSAGAGAGTDGEDPEGGGHGRDLANLPQELRFEPGEILVSDPPAGFESRARQLGFSVINKLTLRALRVEMFRLRVPPGSTVPAAVTRLRRQFPGLSVDANHLFGPARGGRTPELFARSVMGWGRASTQCGHGVRIGAIDGAVDPLHPAFEGRKLDYRSFHDPERQPGAIDHGTAIAAMMVGQAKWGGLLPAAELKHANIFEINDKGRVAANVYGLVKGVDWVVGQDVHVINLSVAGSSNQVLDRVLLKARRMGHVLVAAAGQAGQTAPPAYPAAYDYVIAVTAVDAHQRLYEYANRGDYIEFAAPGVSIWTAVPGGGRLQSGTSFAAPYASVLIALEVARGQARTTETARAQLREQLLDLGQPGRDTLFGWGLIRHPRHCSPQSAG